MNNTKTDKEFWPRQILMPTDERIKEFAKDAGEILAAVSLKQIPPIPAGAIVHDNGCGHGAATAAIMASVSPDVAASIKITGTDILDTAIDAYRTRCASSCWPAEGIVMDADALTFSDNTFTHSIANAMIFLGPRHSCISRVKEMRRTLQPGGRLVVNCFAYTPALETVREASRATRPSGILPAWNAFEDWYDPGVLVGIVEAGGFEKGTVHIEQREMLVNIGNFDRYAALTWSFRGMPSSGWSEDDETKWDDAVEVVKREMMKTEGFQMLEDGNAIIRSLVHVATTTK